MTQTTSAPPATRPAQAAPPAPAPSTPAQPVKQGPVEAWLAGTPGRMRTLLIALAVIAVLFGAAAAQGFRSSDGALKRAEENTAQLVRIQSIHTNLVSANADATNAFLVGGLEPPAQRAHFDQSMATAARLIAEAATAQPADQKALGELNTTLLNYQGLIELARANNRQGLPVGSQYLRDANALVQGDSLPLLTELVKANESRVNTEFDGVGGGNTWLLLAGLITLIAIVLGLIWLAKRTHRYLNFPIAAAGVVVLLTVIIGGSALVSANNSAEDTKRQSYAETLALSRARIAAYDAKSNESLTLIARGSGTAFEEAWVKSSKNVDDQLRGTSTPGLQDAWANYIKIHKDIRDKDNKGNWELAVAQAIGASGQTSNSAFKAFDDSSSQRLADLSSLARSELSDARGGLPPIGWLGLPLGIVAALLIAWGFSQRLEEYR